MKLLTIFRLIKNIPKTSWSSKKPLNGDGSLSPRDSCNTNRMISGKKRYLAWKTFYTNSSKSIKKVV